MNRIRAVRRHRTLASKAAAITNDKRIATVIVREA
jgi:hypothetical protein